MKKILAIDDDTDIHNLLKVFLKNKYDLESSFNGAEAIIRLQNETLLLPDLILLDMEMPVMNGMEFKKKMGSIERLKNIPVIYLTANNQYASKVEHSSDFDFLNKPIEKEDLVYILETFFRHQNA